MMRSGPPLLYNSTQAQSHTTRSTWRMITKNNWTLNNEFSDIICSVPHSGYLKCQIMPIDNSSPNYNVDHSW